MATMMPTKAGITGTMILNLWRNSKMDNNCWWGPKRVLCDVCKGLGWHNAVKDDWDDWATHCTICDGKGEISLHAVAKLIGEDPGVLYRLHEQRIKPKTARRVFPKLVALYSGHVGGLIDAAC